MATPRLVPSFASPSMPGVGGTRIVPDRRAGEGVERVDLVRTGDVEDAIGGERRGFEAEIGDGEDPFQLQRRYVRGADLVERAVAVAGVVAVIGNPVAGLRGVPVNRAVCGGGGSDGFGVDAAQVFGKRARSAAGRSAKEGMPAAGLPALDSREAALRIVRRRGGSWPGRALRGASGSSPWQAAQWRANGCWGSNGAAVRRSKRVSAITLKRQYHYGRSPCQARGGRAILGCGGLGGDGIVRKSADLLPDALDMLILKAVSLKPLHGYGVLLRIRQISGDALGDSARVLVPRALSIGASGLDRRRMGAEREQSPGEVLDANRGGTEASAGRNRRVESPGIRYWRGFEDQAGRGVTCGSAFVLSSAC